MSADERGAADALDADDEELFRQVNPNFVQQGRVSGQAFRPFPKDKGLLSVDRSHKTTASRSFEHFTTRLNLRSDGTYAVTVGECRALNLPALDDPLVEGPNQVANEAHALIDFRAISKSQAEAKGSQLARLATARGRRFPLASPSSPPPSPEQPGASQD